MAVYQTTLKSVNGMSAVGANGERLIFIGNFPCIAGDVVWTDGKVIFGHTVPKTSAIILSSGGVPIIYGDSNYKVGYVNNNGIVKDLPIDTSLSKDDWIVNGKITFKHINEEYIIDAETAIDDNGNENGFYTARVENETGDRPICPGTYYSIENGKVKIDNYISITKNGTETEKIYLSDFDEAIQKVDEIYDEELGAAKRNASGPINGCVQLLAFKLDTNGGWEAIVASFAYGELKYYDIDDRGRWRDKYMHGLDTQVISTTIPLDSIENEIEDKVLLEKFKSIFSPTVTEIIQTVRTTTDIDYFDPPDKIRRCSAYYLTLIKSNGEKEILHENVMLQSSQKDLIAQLTVNGAGTAWMTYNIGTRTTFWYINSWGIAEDIEEIDNRHPITVNHIKHKNKDGYHIENGKYNWTFPIQDNFFVKMNEWQILGFFEDDKEIPVNGTIPTSFVSKKYYMVIAEGDVKNNVIGEYEILCKGPTTTYNSVNDSIVIGYEFPELIACPFIFAMTKAKNKHYLILTDSNNNNKCILYKLNDQGEVEQIAENIQNFRLKRMNNLAKVKDKNNWSE